MKRETIKENGQEVISFGNTNEFLSLLKDKAIANSRWGLCGLKPHPWLDKMDGYIYLEKDEHFSTYEDYWDLKSIWDNYFADDYDKKQIIYASGKIYMKNGVVVDGYINF